MSQSLAKINHSRRFHLLCLALTGRLYIFIPKPGATASPLPWAVILRAFSPFHLNARLRRASSLPATINPQSKTSNPKLFKGVSHV